MPDSSLESVLLLHSEVSDGCGSSDVLRLSVSVLGMLPDGDLRNYLAGSWPAQPLADLRVTAQSDSASESESYGWRVEFRDSYAVDLARAEEMVKVLRKVSRGMAKLEAQFGYCESFGAYVARVASVLGISRFGWRTDTGSGGFYSDTRYHWTDAVGFGLRVSSVCREFRAAREVSS